MTNKTRLNIIIGILGVLVVAPIWYFLLYKILVAIKATELMWFLYWIYVPLGLVLGILGKVAEGMAKS